MSDILRKLPIKTPLLEKQSIKLKYSKEDFNKLNQLLQKENDYLKLINGRNPLTNRKIKMNGGTYYKVIHNNFYNIFPEEYFILKKINQIEYFKKVELEEIRINKINKKIERKNKLIKIGNKIIDDIIKKILNLKNWNDYILFHNKKYGYPYNVKTINDKNIHIYNNCDGEIVLYDTDYSECHLCECWFGCGGGCSYTTKYYKCKECDYEYSEKT